MIVTSFFLAIIGVLLTLLVLLAFNRATYHRGRAMMARELGGFLEDAASPDADRGTGTWRGMPVRIAVNHYSVDFEVLLPYAIVQYPTLLSRYGGAELEARMRRLALSVDSADRFIGSVPRETGLAECLVTVESRIAVAAEVRALREFAPRLLADTIDVPHSARTNQSLSTPLRSRGAQ